MTRKPAIHIVNASNGCFIVKWSEGGVPKTEDMLTFADAEALARKLCDAAGGPGSVDVFDHTGNPPGKVRRLFHEEPEPDHG